MAVNSVGQTLLLQLSNQQVSDLTDGLNLGDVIKGRVIETLAGDKAIINFRGINVTADLQTQDATALAKGDILQVQVKTLPSLAPDALSANLTLQLLGITQPGAEQAQAVQPEAGDPGQAVRTAPAQSPELLLQQLKVPVSRESLAAVRAFQAAGQTVTAEKLDAVLKAAQLLMPPAEETAAATAAEATAQSLQDAKATLLAQQTMPQPALRQVQLRQAAQLVDQVLSQVKAQPLSAGKPDAQQGLAQAAALAANPPQSLEPLVSALRQLVALIGNDPADGGSKASPSGEQTATSQALSGSFKSLLASVPLAKPVLDLLAAQVAQEAQAQPQAEQDPVQAIQKAIQTLSEAVQDPASTLAGQVLRSQAEARPEPVPAQQVLTQAKEALLSMAARVEAAQAQGVRDMAGLMKSVQTQPLLPPNLPRQAVIEALVFLQARNLPPLPSLVEPVAQALSAQQSLTSTLQSLSELAQENPQNTGAKSQTLKESLAAFSKTWQNAMLQPEAPGLAEQFKAYVATSGLDLESRLAVEIGSKPLPPNSPVPVPARPETDLKAALLNIQKAASEVLREGNLSQAERGKVEQVSLQAREALAGMTTLQLASQPLMNRDMATLQVPIWFGQQVVPGKLSVYWKQGKDSKPTDKDPVNVVFLLHTRGLKDVRVSLALYEKDCLCRINVADEGVRDFIKPRLKDLQAGFSANTPYRLKSIDLGIDDSSADGNGLLDGLFAPVEPNAAVNLSA